MIGRNKHYISLYVLLINSFLFSSINSKNLVEPQDSTVIVFIKSNQTLGNTVTFGLAIADVDLDGDNDICLANYSTTDATRLWINDGNGNFTTHSQYFDLPYAAHDVALADLNGDTYPDIFFANHNGPSKFYLSNGDGSYYESSQDIGEAGDHPQTIQLIDIDGDQDNDAYLYNISAPNRIWLNDGTGIFSMRNIDYGGDDSNRQVLADLNNDQFPDLYISYRTQASELWMNDGAGNFTNSGQNLGQSNDDVDFADIDGDGDIDIIGANYSNMSIWLNQNNTGTFTEGFTFNEGAWRCKLFDVDLDGDSDLVTTHLENGNKLWLNDGTGTFIFYDILFETTSTFCIVGCRNLDGDNYIDIVLAKETGSIGHSIYFNKTTIVGIEGNYSSELFNYQLYNNFPNPFNPATTISYYIDDPAFVSFEIFDVLGNGIASLVNEVKPSGYYRADFHADNLPSGIYYYKLGVNKYTETKKMILLK